nr:TlpA disulfide reductase family protein [Caldalkalibacillus mannanilyticus]
MFRSNYDLTFPLLLDPDKIISTKYGVTALPVTYFIDPEGNVVSKVIGELEHDTLIENLDRIMP